MFLLQDESLDYVSNYFNYSDTTDIKSIPFIEALTQFLYRAGKVFRNRVGKAMAARWNLSEVEGEGEKQSKVAMFDYCFNNFFTDMDYICKLCSSPSQHDLDLAEIDRFSAMITFLKEWKYFQYEPRTVSFSCESEGVATGTSPDPVRRELKLPQFSSAAIPKAGNLIGEADSFSSDFVLYAGGSVWALDWCPRADDKSEPAITCEYLAVSAHPPGSNYHKMGDSLKGRGAIQIWCLVTATETVELSKQTVELSKASYRVAKKPLPVTKPRGRPKKVYLTDKISGTQSEPKKIGGPMKRPIEDACTKVPKKRGRPRKYAPSSDKKEDKLPSLVNFNLEGTASVLALPPPPDPNSNEKGSKDICKIGNFQNQEACPVVSGAKPNEDIEKDLWCLKMAQEDHNVVADNEANLFPIVEPLDFELPLSVLYEKKCNKRRLKLDCSKQKPDFVAAQSSTAQDVTSAECQIVEFNSVETDCNAEVKLANTVCCQKEIQFPKLVFCLAHYGKVAWDVKWKPFVTISTARMGYLAVLLGNGSLEVWEVPVPSIVQRVYSSSAGRGEGTDPRFLKLKSVFRCSKLTFGNRQSIPLTLEWSPSPPGDMILAGCHDGTVALWKFAVNTPSEDSRPLLVFTADSSPIRSLAWAPHDSENAEDANLFVVAGTEGLKFWDIRDPYHSLWEVNPAHRAVLSVDWLKDPRCILMSLEDGTMRIFSLPKGSNDLPVIGVPLPRKQFEGIFIYTMSIFSIWSIHTSLTGLVAYCVTDGSVIVFQLNERFLEPEPARNRTPYFSCDNLKENRGILELGPPFRNTIIPNLPLKPIKGPSRFIMGDGKALVSAADTSPKGDEENNANMGMSHEVDNCYNAFPSKLVALQKVRWNRNKGADKWLCYGGASGIIRLQKISFDS